MNFCEQRLGIQVDPNNIDRSHHLGKFVADKNRLRIVNLLRFKNKQSILSFGYKLKDSEYAVRKDLSELVRFVRNKLERLKSNLISCMSTTSAFGMNLLLTLL